MITYAKVIRWRKHEDTIILECVSDGKQFEIPTYKSRIYNAHLLNGEVYIRLDSNGNIIGIDV
ncbi:hypothetical protein [Bacillus gaemokensis]|uniref:Uncharacterized protein n=1 Tax=Bacillus gaemokensis TaxID=574375 RepID=A0A073KF43_9BACI|nr:hypothetical protein [Bacillus gaemokensis]KEK25205.1 hypothetical protein BAGA_11260 [Bacillus gaemokensis]KYG37352.1 hypothetical protein AZF08_08075 [Bacillus gaemokensis]